MVPDKHIIASGPFQEPSALACKPLAQAGDCVEAANCYRKCKQTREDAEKDFLKKVGEELLDKILPGPIQKIKAFYDKCKGLYDRFFGK
jgi:hypothetical protein